MDQGPRPTGRGSLASSGSDRVRGIARRAALGLVAEIGDFRRFANNRELTSYLGITFSEYFSGDQQHRGHVTKAGNGHARRLLIEAASHDRHRTRRLDRGPEPSERAWQGQLRLHRRWVHPTHHGKRFTVTNVAIARELAAFLWRAMTDQPPRQNATIAARPPRRGGATSATPEDPRLIYAIPTRDPSFKAAHNRTPSCGPRPGHLRVTVVVAVALVARRQHPPP